MRCASASNVMRSYPITPVPKPRMTRRDKWMKRAPVLRYRSFVSECQWKCVHFVPGDSIRFVMPMPQSWSKRKRHEMDGQPHTQENADLTNLLKALEDAVYEKDGHLWRYGPTEKVWGYEGAIQIWRDDELERN